MEQIDRFTVKPTRNSEKFDIVDRKKEDRSIVWVNCKKTEVSRELAELLLPIVDEFITKKEEDNEL